jgi:hypothetical protein
MPVYIAVLRVASFVVRGVISSIGPGLLCVLVFTTVLYSVYVYNGRSLWLGVCRIYVPLYF